MKILICPNCRRPLEPEAGSWRCEAGHNFDQAREGYVNLIAGKAPAASQGDSAAMIAARRAFLARGYYQELAAAVAEEVAGASPRVVADFGCGEGYYLGEIMRSPGMEAARCFGTDISKPAVAAAAKAYPAAQFVVADTNRLIPLDDGSADVGICVFAPRSDSEFARVIAPGGRLIVVIPGPGHLAALRERLGLIGIEADKAAKVQASLSSFRLQAVRHVKGQATLDEAALRELVEMTPNARHMSDETRASIAGASGTTAYFEFEIIIFSRYTEG